MRLTFVQLKMSKSGIYRAFGSRDQADRSAQRLRL
jgi:hypothetical protein